MHISSTSPAMKNFDPDIILQFWKQLSMSDQNISLFGHAIPSIYTVNQNEIYAKSKEKPVRLFALFEYHVQSSGNKVEH